MPFELERARLETPGCANVLHFDNAGAALVPKSVLRATLDHLRLEAAIGGYRAAERALEMVEHSYDAAAKLLGCHREEIALVEHATRAWDLAFYSIPFGPGDRILTDMAAYASSYIAFLQVATRTGAEIDVIHNDASGQISVDALRHEMDERVKLIALTHVPTNGGLVNPAAAVGQVAREFGVLYLLDACQSVGQMALQVDDIGCDLLSATGRKYLRGPRGTGFLYVRREVLERLEPPVLDLCAARWVARDRYEMRADARRFESWERNVAGVIGLGVAIDYALGWGLDAIYGRVSSLAKRLRTQLEALPGVTVHDLGRERCGIVSFAVEGWQPEDLRCALAQEAINVSTSTRYSTLLDMDDRGLTALVRASVHYYNSEEEVGRFCAALETLVRGSTTLRD
jgi:cysteine desulfurase/selenocysteine lyase